MINIQDFIIYIMCIVVFLNKPSENQGKFNAKGYQNNNEFTNIRLFFQGLQEIQNLDVQPEKPYRDVLS